jgi:type I pantothenate kinase
MRRLPLRRQAKLLLVAGAMTSVAAIADQIERRRGGQGPFLVGVTGAVAAGKSTFAGQLATAIANANAGAGVEIVCTDGFLMNNAALDARGILGRKGFPESYDMPALRAALAAARTGPADFPGYSHVIYDIDPALTRRVAPADVLIVEGLALHEGAAALGLDALIYLDADEAHLEGWFAERLLGLWRAAEHDPTSFYAQFRHFTEPEARAFAVRVWQAINLPNLRDHIAAARDVADIVVRKGPDHAILALTQRGAAA